MIILTMLALLFFWLVHGLSSHDFGLILVCACIAVLISEQAKQPTGKPAQRLFHCCCCHQYKSTDRQSPITTIAICQQCEDEMGPLKHPERYCD